MIAPDEQPSPRRVRVADIVHPDGLPVPQRWWAMVAIGIGITLSVLDAAIANVALPTIARELHATPAASVWVINAYQLAIVVALLPLAALGERVGYRRVYQAGVIVFTAGSLACALSDSLGTLIAARVVQGLGATGIMAVNGALVRFTYPQAQLGRGVGINALVVSAGSAAGPTIAAGVLAVASWPWLFAINVPIGLVNIVLAARVLPRSDLSAARFDWLSAGLNGLTFGLFFIGIIGLTQTGGGSWLNAIEVLIALAAGVLLFRREAKATLPLIPLDLMRIPIFALSVATSVCAFTSYNLAFLALPFYFETVLHRDQVQTGLLMTPWPLALGLVGPFAGRLSDRVPAAILGTVGLLALAAGLTLLATLPAGATAWGIGWRMALAGFGFGLFQSPNNRTLLTAAPRRRAGAAGGMLATARLTGLTVGATIAALAFTFAPRRAETLDLLIGSLLALAAAGSSLSRLRAA